MKRICIFLAFTVFSVFLYAQEENNRFSTWDVGAEFQAYPTGIIPGVRVETNLSSRGMLHLRLGSNIFDHQDFPKQAGINNHDSETGSGYGFSLGYKHFLKEDLSKLFVGIRSDLWFNTVDWTITDFPNCLVCDQIIVKGQSDILVIQPTVEAGWLFLLGEEQRFFVTPEIGLGYELNVIINGPQTGYGFIGLVGVHLGVRI